MDVTLRKAVKIGKKGGKDQSPPFRHFVNLKPNVIRSTTKFTTIFPIFNDAVGRRYSLSFQVQSVNNKASLYEKQRSEVFPIKVNVIGVSTFKYLS